jgi:ABC-type bacteriocin/lantibiotic exporter with double-glycine peptidase domain
MHCVSACRFRVTDTYLFNTQHSRKFTFGYPSATDEALITAAQQANAHDFIMQLPKAMRRISANVVCSSPVGNDSALPLRAISEDAPILLLDEAPHLDSENERLA